MNYLTNGIRTRFSTSVVLQLRAKLARLYQVTSIFVAGETVQLSVILLWRWTIFCISMSAVLLEIEYFRYFMTGYNVPFLISYSCGKIIQIVVLLTWNTVCYLLGTNIKYQDEKFIFAHDWTFGHLSRFLFLA